MHPILEFPLVNACTGVILNMNVYSIQRGQPKSKRKPQPHSRSFAPASLSSVADDVPDEILGGDDVFFDVATPTSPMVNLFFCDLLIKIPLSEACFRYKKCIIQNHKNLFVDCCGVATGDSASQAAVPHLIPI